MEKTIDGIRETVRMGDTQADFEQRYCLCGSPSYRDDRKVLEAKMKQLCDSLEKKRVENEHLWTSMNKRVPYNIMFWLVGGLFAISVGLMGIVYHQGSRTQEVVIEVHSNQKAMASNIETNTRNIGSIQRQITGKYDNGS